MTESHNARAVVTGAGSGIGGARRLEISEIVVSTSSLSFDERRRAP